MKNLECDGEILLNKHINADASDLSPMRRCCLKPARRKMKTCFPPTKASGFVVLLLLLLPSAAVKTATTLAGTSSMSRLSSVGLYYILGRHKWKKAERLKDPMWPFAQELGLAKWSGRIGSKKKKKQRQCRVRFDLFTPNWQRKNANQDWNENVFDRGGISNVSWEMNGWRTNGNIRFHIG